MLTGNYNERENTGLPFLKGDSRVYIRQKILNSMIDHLIKYILYRSAEIYIFNKYLQFFTYSHFNKTLADSEISETYMCVSHSVMSDRFLCPWDSPGTNTGVDCHSLLQVILSTQGLNLDLLHGE